MQPPQLVPPPYRVIRVKLPTFVILALRMLVKDANDEQHQSRRGRFRSCWSGG